jgi:hypothetical protein
MQVAIQLGMKIIGIILIVIGALGIAYGGFTWTYRDKVVDAGPIQITTDKHKTLPVPPIAGALIMVAGVALVMKPARS